METTDTNDGTEKTDTKDISARFDVAALRIALAKVAGVPVVSRPALSKLIGAHPNSIALWESGKLVGAKYIDKLRDLDARIAKGEKISLSEKKGAKSKKAAKAPKPAKRGSGRMKEGTSAKLATKTAGSFDVKALRTRLGASREVLAKLIGVSAGSIQNWERDGSTIREKNLAKLEALAAKGEKGELVLPARKKGGRPKKATSAPKTVAKRGKGRASGSFDVRALRSKLGASREAFAKLAGVSAASVLNWETPGKRIAEENVARLRELAARAERGEIAIPRGKTKTTSAPKAAKASGRKRAGSFDVRGLRARLGTSREAFSKLLNVSVGSIANWETPGKTIYPANLAKLQELAAKAERGEVNVAGGKRATKALAAAPKRSRTANVQITGATSPVYANVVAVTRGDREALVRFALALPGGSGAKVIAEMLVPIEALESFGG